jgi:hypothetical protein
MEWMLERLEKTPTAVFSQRELENRFEGAFANARREKLVRRVPIEDGSLACFHGGRLLTLIQESGRLVAFDDEDVNFDPVELDPREFVFWQLDFEALGRRVQKANGLSGRPEVLDERLYYFGEVRHPDARVSLVLGLFHAPVLAMRVLRQLANFHLLAGSRTVVITPTFQLGPADIRELWSFDVFLLPGSVDPPFLFDYSLALEKRARQPKRKILTESEVEEYKRYRFKSDLAIEISGLREGNRGYAVFVGGEEVLVPDQPFRLLLRLVLELFRTPNGFMDLEQVKLQEFREPEDRLASEAELAPRGMDQALKRLRDLFPKALDGLAPNQFIERSSGKVRISTHRSCVTVDWRALREDSDDAVIGRIARAVDEVQLVVART